MLLPTHAGHVQQARPARPVLMHLVQTLLARRLSVKRISTLSPIHAIRALQEQPMQAAMMRPGQTRIAIQQNVRLTRKL